MAPDLMVEGTKCMDICRPWIQGECDVSLAQATGFHSMDHSVSLNGHCAGSTVAARGIRVLSSISVTLAGDQDMCQYWWWLEPVVGYI